MNVTPAIEAWLGDALASDEAVVSIGERLRGTRAVRFGITTSRRQLVLKVFEHESPFATQEIGAYDILLTRAPDIIVPVVGTSTALRCILLEQVVAPDLFGALAAFSAHDVMGAMAHAMSELAIHTGDHTAPVATIASETAAMRDGLSKVHELFSATRTPLDATASAAMFELCAWPETPPLALTQGDPAPSNLLWIDRRVVFVDFEYAANRHALFDLAQWYMRCPLPSAWFAALADGVAHRLVSRGMFASRARFDAALQRMCQHAGLYMLTWLPIAAALERDRPWVADWTVRRATLSSLLRLAAVTPHNSALRDASTSLHRALSSRWGDSGDCNIDWAGMIQSSRR